MFFASSLQNYRKVIKCMNISWHLNLIKQGILISLFIINLLNSCPILAQKRLQHDDYNRWNTISEWKISLHGTYATWVEEPGRGDKVTHIKDLNTGTEQVYKRCNSPFLSGDESIFAARIQTPFDTLRQLRIKKTKEKDLPKDSLLVVNLNKHKKWVIADLKDFKIQEKGSLLAALLHHQNKTDSAENKKNKVPNRKISDLIVYTADWDSIYKFPFVSEFAIHDSLPLVIWIRKNAMQDSSFLMILSKDSRTAQLAFAQKGILTKPALDPSGTYIAFLSSADTGTRARFAALLLNLKNQKITLAADSLLQGKKQYRISNQFQPWFSKSGERLFLGYYLPIPEKKKDTLPPDEKPTLDLWSWTDPLLQPHQLKQLEKDKNKAWLMVYSLKDGKLFPAGNDTIERVDTYRNGNSAFALGYNNKPYQPLQSWDDTYYDIYLIDFQNQKYQLLLKKHNSDAALSPDGKYFLWYDPTQRQWYLRTLKSSQVHCLTCDLATAFYNTEHDLPSLPPSYGYAGWTPDSKRVWIYSDCDIWVFDPEGKVQPQNVTAAWRKGRNIRLRYLKEDPNAHYIPERMPLLLSVFFKDDKSSGFLRLSGMPNQPVIDSLLTGPYHFSEPIKAGNANKYLFRRETFREFPDIWVCSGQFRDAKKISEANPWQKDYAWGHVKVVTWTSLQGRKLEGLLYTPDDFSSNRKYPMIVYFYERNADELHRYILPRPSRSIINQSYLVSNDYLVFVPDIIYGTGNPGQDAYDCVVSGVSSLIEKGFVDEKHIGIQGQSWGGYQTAFIITRTDMFACAFAGAPVSNMTSAYGGIRWETGMSRMFQYEKAQSRIGGTLWEKPLNFINNSPVFFADRIKTPLMIMSNDQDGAVPWYQGIELFTAMRRLGKPCWMLVYNGEEHNLKANSWGNRMDLTIRMYQFFDHFLKNKPAPRWMTNGIPARYKGIDLGY